MSPCPSSVKCGATWIRQTNRPSTTALRIFAVTGIESDACDDAAAGLRRLSEEMVGAGSQHDFAGSRSQFVQRFSERLRGDTRQQWCD